MEEAEALCSRIGIMDHGRLIALGTKYELKKMISGNEKILIEVGEVNYTSLTEIKSIRGIKNAGFSGNMLEIVTDKPQIVLQDILFILSKNEIRIKGINMVEPDLETVFLSLTGRKLRD
jgi:ABC-2 type transport system ATP-binding protein